jgi:hypothetical protein
MPMFPWQKKEVTGSDGEKKEEFSLPDELVTQIKAGADSAAKVSTMEAKLTELTSMFQQDLTARQKREKDATDAAAAAARAAKQPELDDELEALLLSNPRLAIQRATADQANAIKLIHAGNVKRDVFDDGDKFPYYVGDMKREIDALLVQQPADFQCNPVNIENTYHTVLGRHTKELVEGKVKSRFAGSQGSGGTSSGSAGSSSTGEGDRKPELTDDIRRAAKQVGIKAEDYLEMLVKDGVI